MRWAVVVQKDITEGIARKRDADGMLMGQLWLDVPVQVLWKSEARYDGEEKLGIWMKDRED